MNNKVLIVEDDDSLREALSLLLSGEGYSVTTAVNGLDALHVLESVVEAPAVILLDLAMPVMNGHTFLEKRRSDPALAAVPVVVLTASDVGVERVRAMGVTYMAKPIDVDALLAVLARHSARTQAPG